MKKEKLSELLEFLKERSTVPFAVTLNAFENDEKSPEVSIDGEGFLVKFKFYKNGKANVRSKFSDRDCVPSKNWIKVLKATMLTAVIKKNNADAKLLREKCSIDENILSIREGYLKRYPYLKMHKRYNISDNIPLSEECCVDLLKNYVTL